MTVPAREKWRRLKLYEAEMAGANVPPYLFLSKNEKTGVSLNVSVTGSCRPSKACYVYCYGLAGPAAFPLAYKKYVLNLRRLEFLATAPQREVNTEADALAAQVRLAGQDFLRWNGVGDLDDSGGAVQLIKALTKRHPWLSLWVSTRKPELARKLPTSPSVHTMLSVDKSTRAQDLRAMRGLVARGRGQLFLAYTQSAQDDVAPTDVSVVFAEHHGAGRAKWSPESRTCPATIHASHECSVPHSDACIECKRCFDLKGRSDVR